MKRAFHNPADPTPAGRPPAVTLAPEERVALRKAFIKSNRARGAGSMALAAHHTALDPQAPLRETTRDAIVRARHADRPLPVEVRRALRASDAAIAMYRDPDALRSGGIHAVGCMRMTTDAVTGEMRRLHAGERWSGDDASINFGVCVPWPWGGDKCSDRFGVRLGRFQLLAFLDDATHKCVGWSYIVRIRDSYRSEDVIWTLAGLSKALYRPDCVVLEGGAWQSQRTLDFLQAAGIRWEDAKGRPQAKLIENWFNDLWTVLSVESDGQIGRYRGEMVRENDLWKACREGRQDPRRCFPMLAPALNAIQRGIEFKDKKPVHSRLYGHWIPEEAHAEGIKANPRRQLEPGLEYLTARVRKQRKVGRFGQIRVTSMSPVGEDLQYHFAGPELAPWHGASVWAHFDPFAERVEATVTLAERFRDTPAGTLIARRVACITSAPTIRVNSTGWSISFSNGLAAAALAKRQAQAVVRRELRVASLDGHRVVAESQISAPEATDTRSGIAPAAGIDFDKVRADARARTDVKQLEAFEAAQRVAAG